MKKSAILESFLFYHKKNHIVLENKYFTPVQVGAEVNEDLDLGFFKDNGFESHISNINKYVAEFSGWYAVWKNRTIKSDYVGFGHYRRLLSLKDHNEYFHEMSSDDLLYEPGNYGYDDKYLKTFLYKYDILFPKRNCVSLNSCNEYADSYLRKMFTFYTFDTMKKNIDKSIKNDQILTMKEHYNVMHIGRDFDCMMNIIKKYVSDDEFIQIEKVANTKGEHNGNLPIMKKEIFYDFMEWVNPIMIDLYKEIDYSKKEYNNGEYQGRVFGFLSERLFVLYAYSRRYKIYNLLPIINIVEVNYKFTNKSDQYVKVDINYLRDLQKEDSNLLENVNKNMRCQEILKLLRSNKITNYILKTLTKIYDKTTMRRKK